MNEFNNKMFQFSLHFFGTSKLLRRCFPLIAETPPASLPVSAVASNSAIAGNFPNN
jgi:hypothetical protein